MNWSKVPLSVRLIWGILLISVLSFGVVTYLHADSRSMTPAKQAAAAPNVTDTTKWSKVFSDEFTGHDLDSSKWVTCYDWYEPADQGCTNAGNDELEWYTKDQVSVGGGAATLTAEKKPFKSYPYRSGMISTGRTMPGGPVKWSATYGYFEARIRTDGGKGVWPAFWLLPTGSTWPPEIDIMELLGDQPHQVLLTSHWADAAGTLQETSSRINGPDYTAGWHTYAVNWQPDSISWYIDGRLQKQAYGPAVPHQPMEIILDLAVGGRLPGNPDATTKFPRQMQVDYVRVYGKKL